MSAVELGGYRRDVEHPDFRRWIVSGPGPVRPESLTAPVPAIARVRLYDGDIADVDVEVLTRAAGGLVCVRQRVTNARGEPSTWNAWVEAARVRRRP